MPYMWIERLPYMLEYLFLHRKNIKLLIPCEQDRVVTNLFEAFRTGTKERNQRWCTLVSVLHMPSGFSFCVFVHDIFTFCVLIFCLLPLGLIHSIYIMLLATWEFWELKISVYKAGLH